MVYFARATLQFDGACRPNPGEGGAGYVIFNNNNGNHILEGQYYVGYYDEYGCTNNIAEYHGLIKGLEALENSVHEIGHLTIEGDSQTVIKHMTGENRVNSDHLRVLVNNVNSIINRCYDNNVFGSHSYNWIYRENNRTADGYANDAIDMKQHSSWDNYLPRERPVVYQPPPPEPYIIGYNFSSW